MNTLSTSKSAPHQTAETTSWMKAAAAYFLSRASTLLPSLAAFGQALRQRRRLTRLQCRRHVSCQVNSQTVTATVVDMSLKGMRLEVPRRIRAGELIAVRYIAANGSMNPRIADTVHVRVLWWRKKRFFGGGEIGVAYQESEAVMERSWVKHLLHQIGFEPQIIRDRRKLVRARTSLRGELRVGQASFLLAEGSVIDLSEGGALFESEAPVRQGAILELEAGPHGLLGMLRRRAAVVRVARATESDRWMVSLRFEAPRIGETDLVPRYVRHLLAEAA